MLTTLTSRFQKQKHNRRETARSHKHTRSPTFATHTNRQTRKHSQCCVILAFKKRPKCLLLRPLSHAFAFSPAPFQARARLIPSQRPACQVPTCPALLRESRLACMHLHFFGGGSGGGIYISFRKHVKKKK